MILKITFKIFVLVNQISSNVYHGSIVDGSNNNSDHQKSKNDAFPKKSMLINC